MINDLNAAMQSGQGKVVLGNIIMALAAYAKEHFAEEETAMRRSFYPGFVKHYEEHEEFSKRVDKFLTEYQAGNTLISIDVLRFLNSWLQDHILKSDKAYAAHLNKYGIH